MTSLWTIFTGPLFALVFDRYSNTFITKDIETLTRHPNTCATEAQPDLYSRRDSQQPFLKVTVASLF